MANRPSRQEQKIALTEFAAEVRARLADANLTCFKKSRGLRVEYSDGAAGWYATLGSVTIPGISDVNAYLDAVPGDGHLSYYVCLHVSGRHRVEAVAKALSRFVGPALVLKPERLVPVEDGCRYVPALGKSAFDRPIVETGWAKGTFFGIYLGRYRRGASGLAYVSRAVKMLAQSLGELEHWKYRKVTAETRVIHKRVTVLRTAVPRSSALAQARREHARYRCEICRIRPEDRYGFEGRAVLEAHHVTSVASGRKKTTSLSDLICVCANCHRVLGKLPDGERGLRALRAKFGRE